MTDRTPTHRTRPARRTPSPSVEASVLDAAAHLLEAEGPHALSIRRIAAAAGVAPMTIYNRFESKAGVLDALFVRGFERLAVISAHVHDADHATPALDRLREASWLYRDFALHDAGTYALMFDKAVADFEPSPVAHEAANACFSRLTRSVAMVQAEGAIVGGDPSEVAQRFWAAMHGAVSLERRGICFAPRSEQHYAALVETLLLGLDPARGVPGDADVPA